MMAKKALGFEQSDQPIDSTRTAGLGSLCDSQWNKPHLACCNSYSDKK